ETAGAEACESAVVRHLPDRLARSVMQCYLQCIMALRMEPEEDEGPTSLQAKPELTACEHPELSIPCRSLRLTCSKPVSEIPNRCTGAVRLVRRPQMIWGI
ncbi:unnamed protein product, partial [Symbiodinium pilosum]